MATGVLSDISFSAADVSEMTDAWAANQVAVQERIVSAQGFNWQLLNCDHYPTANSSCHAAAQDAPNRNQTDPRTKCTEWMRAACTPEAPLGSLALFFGFSRVEHRVLYNTTTGTLPNLMQDLASFLLVSD